MSLDVYLKLDGTYVFDNNITHNLNTMAKKAGLYLALWHPEDIKATKAKHLIDVLKTQLVELICYKNFYETFNPENGWGNYENLLTFVIEYLHACKEYPEADIEVSR